jgi:nucleotide-binding universal stress UspA family protein
VRVIVIRQILCPLDFSTPSNRALEHAAALAHSCQSSLLAMHVVPLAVTAPTPSSGVYPVPAVPQPELRRAMLEELERRVEPLRGAGLAVETLVRDGDPAGAVLREAERLPIDLVVMGSHGASGFERLVMGSVSEKVLRKAPCPVLTVGPPAARAAAEPVRYARLLCPIDFSEASLRALEYALTLCDDAAAELALLHVRERVVYPFVPERSHEEADIDRAALSQLESLLPVNARDFCRPRLLVRHGRPHEEIREQALEMAADIVVLGVHGRGLLERLVFGSVTSQVVRSASCPVLTVRPTTRAAQAREAVLGAASNKADA